MTEVQAPTQSLFDKLTNVIYLDYVLKVLGVILLALSLINGWSHLTLLEKIGFVTGPVAWYVGARFGKIYR